MEPLKSLMAGCLASCVACSVGNGSGLSPGEELDGTGTGETTRAEIRKERTLRTLERGASHLNEAFPKFCFDCHGLISLFEMNRRMPEPHVRWGGREP